MLCDRALKVKTYVCEIVEKKHAAHFFFRPSVNEWRYNLMFKSPNTTAEHFIDHDKWKFFILHNSKWENSLFAIRLACNFSSYKSNNNNKKDVNAFLPSHCVTCVNDNISHYIMIFFEEHFFLFAHTFIRSSLLCCLFWLSMQTPANYCLIMFSRYFCSFLHKFIGSLIN